MIQKFLSIVKVLKDTLFDKTTFWGVYLFIGVILAYLNQKDIVRIAIDLIAFALIVYAVYLIIYNRKKEATKKAVLDKSAMNAANKQ